MATNAITPYQQLKKMISTDEIKARFQEVLGQKTQGFLTSVLNTVYLNDNLSQADPNSIMTSALTAAALDLPVDPNLGFSWIIPYNVKGNKVARFQLGYRGYIQLALRTGQYETINVVEIYEGEDIKEDRLTGKVILNGKRVSDQVKGYVAYFRLLNGFEKYLLKYKGDIEAHAKKYSKSWGNQSSPWTSDFDKMAKKTVLKELISKYGIMSIQMQTAIEQDKEPEEQEQEEMDLANVIDGRARDVEQEPQSFNAVTTLISEGICENDFAATGLLNSHVPDELKTNREALIKWGKLYRAWRDMGDKPADAASKASEGLVAQ